MQCTARTRCMALDLKLEQQHKKNLFSKMIVGWHLPRNQIKRKHEVNAHIVNRWSNHCIINYFLLVEILHILKRERISLKNIATASLLFINDARLHVTDVILNISIFVHYLFIAIPTKNIRVKILLNLSYSKESNLLYAWITKWQKKKNCRMSNITSHVSISRVKIHTQL